MISPAYRELRKRPKNSKTLKTLHPLEIIQFIHFVQEGVSKMDTPSGEQDMTIINELGLYSSDLWGNKTLLHRPGSSRMLPSQPDAAACLFSPLSQSLRS